ncbi:MAG TPA: hypothetical protein VFR00_01035, partial [Hyphomicrobiaceae bacterium]|nr:hypothetical protein [Hyphomicrobiaceae bacterium]
MPQPTPIKPGPSSQADAHVWRREHAGSAPSHRGAAAEAGEAAWHHNAAFEQLASRVECLSARIEATRSALGVEGVGLFEGVADALAALKTGIVSVRCAWESDDPWLERLPPRQARPVSVAVPSSTAETDPWDAESAEALTRVCEIAALEDQQPRAGRRPGSTRATEPLPERASDLDGRLADLADRLQQALPGLDPARWLAPLDQRIRQLEQAVAATSTRATGAPEAESLIALEMLIRELAVQLEHTRAELGRLDAVDAHLRDMVGQLKDLAATAKPSTPAPPGSERDGARRVEALLQTSLAARRQDARAAVGVLKSIHAAVGQLAARLDALRPPERSPDQDLALQIDPDADRDLLLKAYREG